jgi:hypothetical protein
MKINNRPNPPAPSSVGSHDRARQTTAPTQAPRQEGPRHEPSAPLPEPVRSRYDTAQARGGPAVPSRAPSPREQAAYNTRTSSLGYGRPSTPYHAPDSAPPRGGVDDLHESFAHMRVGGSARTGQPQWRISSSAMNHVDSVLLNHFQQPMQGASVTQYISQQSNHQFTALQGSGACSAITTNWFKAGRRNSDPQQASADFNHRLGNSEALVRQQQEYLRKHADVRNLISTIDTAKQEQQHSSNEVYRLKGEIDGLTGWARDNGLSSSEKRHYAQLDSEARHFHSRSPEYQAIRQQQQQLNQTAVSRAYSPRDQQKLQTLNQEFQSHAQNLKHLHREIPNHEDDLSLAKEKVEEHQNGGLQKQWTQQYRMQGPVSEFGGKVAEEAAQQPGFYRISLQGDGRAHAMGVQNLGNGQFKFMDPNSGEFLVNGEAALKAVVAQNARKMGYADDASSFEIQHLA